MHYGFLDESGILERKAKAGGYFVVTVIVVGNPAEIKYVMKIARRKVPGKFHAKGIFKAKKAHAAFIKAILRELAKREIDIVVGVWDKRKRTKRVDKNELYRSLVSQTVRNTLKLYPVLNLVVHKRYTNPKLQIQLRDAIAEEGARFGKFIAISQEDERQRKELELVDAVAYAVFQKYNRKKNDFYEIIEDKITKESRLAT